MTPASADNEAEPTSSSHRRLSDELAELIESLDEQDITLGDLVDRIGERGFGLLLAILSLPAALPLPAPGYATPFGLMMIVLGVQMVLHRTTPSLPEIARRRKLGYKTLKTTLGAAGSLFRFTEFLVRPRLVRLAKHRSFHALVGVVVILMACSMSLPIPLTNTFPSFVIFVLACGLLEEDGLVLLGGLLIAPLAGGVAVLAIYVAWHYGLEALEGGLRATWERVFG